ncbi:MYND-type domain-containing protein [Mycena kentingensis (nom. inval.)]|nr:MYND-type domain-containing protein [Mycena kentingensis (nom. inval.)]
MHPIFDVVNLRKLPASVKTRAQKAAEGSIDDIVILSASVARDPKHRLIASLAPVFHLAIRFDVDTLHPDDWIYMDTSCSATPFIMDGVSAGLKALNILISESHVAADAFSDIWEQLAQWMVFLDKHQKGIPERVAAGMYEPCAEMGFLLLSKSRGEDTFSASDMNPKDTWSFVVAAWNYLLPKRDNAGLDSLAKLFMAFTNTPRQSSRSDWSCLISAAGGYDPLARIIVRQVRHTWRVKGDAEKQSRQMTTLLWTLGESSKDSVPTSKDNFYLGLLKYGIVAALTRGCRRLSDSGGRDLSESTFELFRMMLSSLYLFLDVRHNKSSKSLANAVHAGLLLVIHRCLHQPLFSRLKTAPDGDNAESALVRLAESLENTLPQFTNYLSFLRASEPWLSQIAAAGTGNPTAQIPAMENWTKIVRLLEARMEVVRLFDAGALSEHKACDNLECGHIGPRAHFKRCGGCLAVYYCSRDCQREDYDEMHRAQCQKPTDIDVLEESMYRSTDRTFLRALMTHGYRVRRFDIAMELLAFFRSRGSASVLPCVQFEYTADCQYAFSVRALRDAELALVGSTGVNSPLQEAFVHASEGDRTPIMLHVMRIANGKEALVRVFLLRAESMAVVDGLRDLARRNLNGSTVELEREEVGRLLEKSSLECY